MAVERLLCAWAFLWLAGSAASQPPGLDFAVVFMQNVLPKSSRADLELLLTSFFPDTMVHIRLPRRYFSKGVSLTTGTPKSVALPEKFELLSSARSNMTVRITSNKPISVVAINKRPHSTGVTVVSPISDWGSEYYIMTPEASLEGSLGQVAIVNGPKQNFISVLLRGLVQLENTTYLPGERLNVTLGPWESVQLQTNQSLTASHLVSQEDVALFAGLGCTGVHSLCRHVYLQMSATTLWGSNFVLPPVPSPGKITILTYRDTLVRLIHGNDTTDVMVTPGVLQVLEIDPTTPLLISSVEQILVLLDLGGNNESSSASGVLLNLPPIEKSCVSYAMITLAGFNNSVLLVATKDSSPGLELNRKPLLGLQWKSINMTQLVYTDLPLGNKQGYNFISDAGHDFGLATFGMGSFSSFALPGICLDKEHLLCGFECKDSTCNSSRNSSTCVLLESPTCMAWGQSHLLTFYGSPMRRSSLGPHILIYSQGDDLSLQPFKVERDARSDLVVRIWVFDLVLEISPSQPGVVLVNNKTLYTPVSLSDGQVNLTRFGFLASIVNVSFGLHAIIGDHGFLHIQVAGRYYDSLSGDCVAQSSKEMLNSTAPSLFDALVDCELILVEDLNLCDGTSSPLEFSNCKIISESETFQSCHLTLNPDAFVQSCESEVCNGGFSCPAIESYALACGINGVYLTGWRNISHCGLHCPSHSHYDGCPTKCPASCSETDLFTCDPSLCYEACICDEGYELSAGSCVPKPQCGCYWQSSYYPEVDFIGKDCQTRCLCSGPYVECQPIDGCDAGSTCETNGTVWYCQPSLNTSCMLYSDSHFIAFDGKAYSFNGLCGPAMVGVCSNYSSLEAFEVNIVQDLVLEAYIKAVNITVYGRTITFSPEHSGQVYVDGILVYTPYVVGTSLQIYTGNIGAVILQTDFELVVSFDQMKRLLIKVPASYLGSLCGLCTSVMDEASNKSSCVQYCGDGCYKCSNEADLMEATTSCGLIKDPWGPFRECYGTVDPSTYYDTCVAKLCSGSSLCPTFSAYAATCQEAGANIDPWRRQTYCGYECPPFSTHSDCAANCPLTCGGSLPLTCEPVCHEGCQCEPGYLLSGDRCVPPHYCGCYVGGQYWRSGDIFYEDQCLRRCTCVDDQIICERHNCPSEEPCATLAGVEACYPLSSTCLVSGQTCLTFDGLSYPANNCLMATGESTEGLVGFQVQLRRKGMNNGDLASVHKAILVVYGYRIALSLNSEALEINGNLTNFPVNLDNRIFGYRNGSHFMLQTVFGLQLTVNSSVVSLTIPVAYAGRVWGLCGNYNARSSDDTADLPVWLLSDKTFAADYTLCSVTQDDVPYRTPATQYCELLMEVEGPFQECHVLLDPKGFYNGCMAAVNGDDMHLVCQHIQNYSNECQLAGARNPPWKNETLCQSKGAPIEKFFNLTTSSPFTAPLTLVPVQEQCLPRVVPAACLSLHETSCVFQTAGSFPWPDQSSPVECSLPLVEVCRNNRALDYFSVSVHYKVLGNQSTESVHVEVYGLNLVVPRSWENGVLVNQIPASLPACIIPGKLQIRLEGHYLILDAFNGLVLKYNHKGFLLIWLPFGHQGYLCGQCAMKETSETRIMFTGEVSNHSANQCLITVAKEPWTSYEGSSPGYCNMLLGGEGPFSDCHRILSPDRFYDDCKFHICQELENGGNGVAAACRDLEDYVTLCQFQNVSIKPWRNESFCPFTCPPHGSYELCTRTCNRCPGGSCQEPCLEGCRCTEGFLWDGTNCVTSEMCSKRIFPATPQHRICEAVSTTQGKCQFCQLNYSQILTLGNISSPLEGNGAYDVLQKCDSAAPQWLRIVLRLQPPKPAKLHVFYDRSFITINSTLAVWVNGRLQALPITLAPELQVSKGADVVVLGRPGNMAVTFSSAGDLKIEVAEALVAELCGACTYGDTFSLETWRAEDLS